MKNHYAVLGVPPSSSGAEIKRAFRRLARKWHPDVNEDKVEASMKFREVAEAYAVLGDSVTRRTYDGIRSRRVTAFMDELIDGCEVCPTCKGKGLVNRRNADGIR